jgi:2-polyprenyl-3-methyl-5-hydroxy-6-metoxy-1,4-benzoquinol methylase
MAFMNPQYSREELNELYAERDAEAMTGVYQRIANSKSVQAEYAKKLELLERLAPKGRLLDFACGSGAFFELAQKRGWDAHGLEIGKWAAQAAESRGLKKLHVGTLESVGFEPASFDVVYAAQVLEHLPTPRLELGHLRELLKPNGILYVDVPNYRTLSIVLGKDDFMLNEPPQHVNYFTAATLSSVVSSAGFEVVRTGSGGGLKWENIVGRRIKSDIASAYGLVPDTKSPPPATNGGQSVTSRIKSVVMRTFVQPVLYTSFKVGMVLFAVARRADNSSSIRPPSGHLP